jgi:sugar phosphate isomerase/epimerase
LLCVGPKANHDEVIKQVTVSIRRAGKAGVKTIVFGSSGSRKVPAGWDAGQALDQFVAVLKRMGPIAGDHGVTIAIEPLNAKECNFINRIGEVAEAARRADHPAIRGVADLYHMILGGDTPEDLQKALPFVHHVEIAEPQGRTLPPKNGQDFRAFFRVLHAAKFQGTLSMEGRWADADVAPAFAELRKQWTGAAS